MSLVPGTRRALERRGCKVMGSRPTAASPRQRFLAAPPLALAHKTLCLFIPTSSCALIVCRVCPAPGRVLAPSLARTSSSLLSLSLPLSQKCSFFFFSFLLFLFSFQFLRARGGTGISLSFFSFFPSSFVKYKTHVVSTGLVAFSSLAAQQEKGGRKKKLKKKERVENEF